MNTLEVGPIISELYNVVFYMYCIDEGNVKRTIAYRPDRSQQQHDGGFLSLFKTDKRDGDSVTRLFCEHTRHF